MHQCVLSFHSQAIAGLDRDDNRNGNCLSKKMGWTREKERGNLKMGLFFHAVLFCIFFLLFFFNVGWLISYQDQVNCWTGFSCKISLSVIQIWWSIYYSPSSSQLFIGYFLQDFSSSHLNLVITFLFGNYSVRVNCRKYLYSALTQDRVANFLGKIVRMSSPNSTVNSWTSPIKGCFSYT